MTDIRDADDTREHVVYRLYNDAEELLYVGCTRSLEERLSLHHVGGYSLVVVESYPDRLTARVAERAAIATEAPLLNKQHNPTRFRACKGGGFDPVEPIHPLTAQMLHNERPVTQEEMRAALELVAERLGLNEMGFGRTEATA